MLYDEIEEPGERDPAALRAAYGAELVAAIESAGVDRVVEESGVDRGTVEAILSDSSTTVDLADAAAILAVDHEETADGILLEVRDHLLLGMTTAVLDVDTVAAELDADLTAKEIQQKIEGRAPMTLEEYALLHQFIATRADAW